MSPTLMRSTPGKEARELKMGEPHRWQNTRFFPGEDSYCANRLSPRTSRNAFELIGELAANGAPCALRHCWQ
jgi:hypothetical protein